MPAPCVWITRTEPGASRLEARLVESGYRVFKQPLLEIEPRVGPEIEEQVAALADSDVCIALSAHAVRLGTALLKRPLSSTAGAQWLAVGAGTAQALAEAGVEAQRPALESSEGILATETLADIEGRRIGLLCGEGGRELLGDELRQRGAEVTRIEVYRRVPVGVDPAWLAREVAEVAEVSVVLVASVAAGESLMRLLDQRGRSRLAALAGSKRIAATLDGAGFDRVSVARGADDEAMLAGLRGVMDE